MRPISVTAAPMLHDAPSCASGAQLRDVAGVDERAQLAMLLGDPEPDVGRAGDKLRIRTAPRAARASSASVVGA